MAFSSLFRYISCNCFSSLDMVDLEPIDIRELFSSVFYRLVEDDVEKGLNVLSNMLLVSSCWIGCCWTNEKSSEGMIKCVI